MQTNGDIGVALWVLSNQNRWDDLGCLCDLGSKGVCIV